MFNLVPFWGKAMCQKETPKNVFPFPSCTHVFIFPHVWEAVGRFDHPSFTFSVFFPRCACPVHHLALTEMLWSILIILYSILCMCAVRSSCLQNHVLFWVVRLLLRSSVLLCNGLLCHIVSGSMFCCVDIVVCCVCIFFPWFELVWSGIEEELT